MITQAIREGLRFIEMASLNPANSSRWLHINKDTIPGYFLTPTIFEARPMIGA